MNSPIHHIVVHHSASSFSTTIKDIESWHLARGFSQIGYHIVIDGEGKINYCRPVSKIPASIKGFNTGTLAVCVIGNFEKDSPKGEQIESLLKVIKGWKDQWPEAKVIGHLDKDATLCPGKNLYTILKSYYP